jgi:hypothetical protein
MIMQYDDDGYPQGLSMDKLGAVVALIKQARDEAYERHDPDWADDNQVLGMRAYKRSRLLLSEAAIDGTIEGLSIHDPNGRLTLVVDGVPLRYWRNWDYEDSPEERRMEFSPLALQMSLFDSLSDVDRWAINYHTDADGRFMEAALVGYDSISCCVVRFKRIPLVEPRTARPTLLTENLPEPESVDTSSKRVRLKVVGNEQKKNE